MSDPTAFPRQLATELADKYRIIRLLGRGGMGEVWLAHESSLDRPVAIKLLSGDKIDSDPVRERFRREARIAARLVHPHIVPLHAFGETRDALYFVMGYVEGETLAARLDREGRLSRREAARILGEIADALEFAHREGVVHRDVKPENILLDARTGRAMLADFGVARLQSAEVSVTMTGMAVGTPTYMSPEQAVGMPDIDGRSDLYSLGVVGYRMLAGRLPFNASTGQALMAQHASQRAADLAPLVPPDAQQLASVIMRALEKDPAARWARAEDMRAELASAARSVASLPAGLERVQMVGTKLAAATGAVGMIWALAGLWNDRILTSDAFATPLILTIGFFPMITAGVAAVTARTHGWRATLHAMFNPPRSWAHWWPRGLRRKDDIWDRLPKSLRRLRNVIDGVVGFLIVDIIGLLALATTGGGAFGDWLIGVLRQGAFAVPPLVYALPRIAMLGWVGFEYFRARRLLGLTASEVNELLGRPHIASDEVWAQPRYARLLAAETGAPALAGVPSMPRTPDDLVRAIVALSRRLQDGGLLPDGESAAAARHVRDAIVALDDEIRRLSSEIDPAEGQRLEKRLAAALDADLRELLESQRGLWRKLQQRLADKQARRERLTDQLKTLWMQLFELDARLTRGAPVNAEVTSQVRALIGEIGRAGDALSEVERLTQPLERRESTPVP